MRTPQSHIYHSQGLPLHYVDWGNANAPLLLLLHGGRDHCRNWDWLADSLCDRWHIVAPDLRGHGDSAHVTGQSYTMSAWVYDIATLIAHLDPPALDIIGHSLGGNIALRYTGIYPTRVRHVVAIEGLGPSPARQAEENAIPIATRMATWIDACRTGSARAPRYYASIAQAAARMQAQFPHLAPEVTRHLARHGVRETALGYQWKFDPALYTMVPDDIARADIHSLWRNISCPTLLVYGQDSWASNPETDGRIAHLPTAEVLSVPQAGHWVHHDRFALFRDAVEAFLTKA